MVRVICLYVLIFSTWSFHALAQDVSENYGVMPFPQIPETLPVSFKGNDLKAIVIDLANRGKELGIIRDEFTQLTEFEHRTAQVVEKLNANGKFLYIPRPIQILTRYNADKQAFDIKITASSLTDNSKPTLAGVEMSSESQELGEYAAANAFNRSVTVKKRKITQYILGFTNDGLAKNILALRPRYLPWFAITLPMATEEAREASKNLSILFVSRMRAPPLLNLRDNLKPTIETPLDVEFEYRVLYSYVDELWIFNRATGKVYQKIR